MNKMNRRKLVIGTIGTAGLALLFYANTLSIVAHASAGTGSLSLSVPLGVIFAAATGFFGKLAVDKARYLFHH